MSSVNKETVIAAFIKTRDELDAMQKEFDEKVKPLKDLQAKREEWLAGQLLLQGETSTSTPSGTAFFKKAESVTVEDWDMVWEYINKEQRFDLLTHSVNKTAVLEGMGEKRDNAPPPGVKYTAIQKIHIRRPTKK